MKYITCLGPTDTFGSPSILGNLGTPLQPPVCFWTTLNGERQPLWIPQTPQNIPPERVWDTAPRLWVFG